MSTPRLDLFDGRGVFVMPDADTLAAALDTPEKAQRFEGVRLAAQAREKAADATKAARDHVTRCAADLIEAENVLRRVRPKVSAVEAARAVMRASKHRY